MMLAGYVVSECETRNPAQCTKSCAQMRHKIRMECEWNTIQYSMIHYDTSCMCVCVCIYACTDMYKHVHVLIGLEGVCCVT